LTRSPLPLQQMSHRETERKDIEEEEELFPPPNLDNFINYSNVVIVDNLPVIPKEKEEKLVGVLKKIFGQFGTVECFFMPFDKENSKSCGFAFIEFSNQVDARNATEKLNNYKLDKAHVFKTNLYEDFETYDKIPSEYRVPEEPQFEKPDDLYDWLNDIYGCDQFVIRYGDEPEIMWYGNPVRSVTKVPTRSESFVQWSPKGTYLVTFHQLGVILWGGPNWKKLRKIRHNGVELVDFSPNENYLVTFSPSFLESDVNNKDPQSIIIWDVKTGLPMRSFQRSKNWPEFQWSHDDKYFSRINKGLISVFETPKMVLLEENECKSIKLHGSVKDYAWSPTDNILCAYIPEFTNIPAHIVLMEIPSKTIIGEKAVFNVSSCVILWQDKGDYLAVKMDLHTKSKKKKPVTLFEFFRIRERNIPVDDLKFSDSFAAFSWEPKGQRFAILHSDSDKERTRSVSFYSMAGKTVQKLETLEKRQVSHITWSSRGRFIVLLSSNGVFEFYDAQNQETMAVDKQHMLATDVRWDPTGRYLTTFVSAWKQKTEHGYKIWSFRGTELLSVIKKGFVQFEWRPRPPTLLSAEDLRNLEDPVFFKKFRTKYKLEDRFQLEERNADLLRERERSRIKFRELMRKKREEYEADVEFRRSLGIKDEEEYLVEDSVEELIGVVEEVVED